MGDYLYVIIALIGLMALYLTWLKVIAPKVAGVRKLSMAEYRVKFKKEPHILLDVRSDSEFAAAHAPRARHMPVEEVAKSNRNAMQEIIGERAVICICASGSRSMMASTVIARMGFSPVYSITGGMSAWQSAGMTVRRSRD